MANSKKTATKTQFWLLNPNPILGHGTSSAHAEQGRALGRRSQFSGKQEYEGHGGRRSRVFYHSVNEKRIMGSVQIIREHYPDHTDPKGRFGMVILWRWKQRHIMSRWQKLKMKTNWPTWRW